MREIMLMVETRLMREIMLMRETRLMFEKYQIFGPPLQRGFFRCEGVKFWLGGILRAGSESERTVPSDSDLPERNATLAFFLPLKGY